MHRVGLITLHRDNYGSELQCFATKHYFESHGVGCDVLYLNQRGVEKLRAYIHKLMKYTLKAIRYRDFLQNRSEQKRAAEVARASWAPESKWELDYFANSVLQPKGYDLRSLEDRRVRDIYDYFIVGSDQIWSGANNIDPFRFLEFAEDEKKVALSVSFGTSSLKDFNIADFRRDVSRFKNLTVREQAGVDLVRSLTGREVPRLADPVILLDRSEWARFAKKSNCNQPAPYIFAHFLDEPSEAALRAISLLLKNRRLSLCIFGYPRKELDALGDSIFIAGSPYDYVNLIEHASYVCTDSFHTSQFSIIFNRAFMIFERNYVHSSKQSSRIETMLDVYDCHNRLVGNEVTDIDDLPLDAPNFDAIRLIEQQEIRCYLGQFIKEKTDVSGQDSPARMSVANRAVRTIGNSMRTPPDA